MTPRSPGEVYLSVTINAQITIGGALTLNGFVQVQAAAGSNGLRLQITGAVGTTIPFLGALSGQLSFTVFLGPNPGVVGRVFLSLDSSQIPGVQLSGEFLLELNTFATAQEIQTFKVNQDSSGNFAGFAHDARGNLVVQNTIIAPGPGFKLLMSGHIMVGILDIQGSVVFGLSLGGSNPNLSLVVNGSVVLGPLGALQLKNSGFRIDRSGLVARIQLSLDGNFGGSVGLQFNAGAILSLNTTGATQSLGGSSVPDGFDLGIQGFVTFAGFATASGSVDLTISASAFQLDLQRPVRARAAEFHRHRRSRPLRDGMALSLQVQASANGDVFSISAGGTLMINTSSTTSHLGINPSTFQLALNGQVSILKVFNFDASLTIIVAGGQWSFDTNAHVSFFGIWNMDGEIFLDSYGDFHFHLSAGISFGCCGFGLSGSVWVDAYANYDQTYGYYDFGLSGGISADVEIAGIDFGGASLSFGAFISTRNGTDGAAPIDLNADFSIHILFVTVHKSINFRIGYLQLPKPVFLAGSSQNPRDFSQSTDGNLILNVGSLASQRNIATDDPNHDAFQIKQIGGSAATGATIQVTAFGRTNTFKNVKTITADWSGCATSACTESINVDPSVTIPVFITGSGGSDNLQNDGSNVTSTPSTVSGGGGDNTILIGGPGAYTVYGNSASCYQNQSTCTSGHNTIIHNGTGPDDTGTATIYGGSAGDTITGASIRDTINAGNGNDTINGPAGTIYTGGGTNLINLTAGGGTTTINPGGGQGTNTLDLTADGSGDTFSGSGNTTSFTLNFGNSQTITANGVQQLVLHGGGASNVLDNLQLSLRGIWIDGSGPLTLMDGTSLASTGTGGNTSWNDPTVCDAATFDVVNNPSGACLIAALPTATNLVLNVGGPLAITGSTLSSRDALSLTSSSGDLTLDNSSATAATSLTATAAGALTLKNTSSLTALGGNLTATAGAGANLTGSALSATNGSIILTAPGGVTLLGHDPQHTGPTETPTLSATGSGANIVISSGGSITATDYTLTSGTGSVSLCGSGSSSTICNATPGAITLIGTTISAPAGISAVSAGPLTVVADSAPSALTASGSGSTIKLNSTQGGLTLTSSSLTAASGTITLNAGRGDLALDAPTIEGGTATTGTASANISIQGGTLTSDTGTLTLTATGNLTLAKAALASGAAATLTATNGALSMTGGSLTGGSLTATSGTTLTIASAAVKTTGDVALTAHGAGVSSANPALLLDNAAVGAGALTGGTGALTVTATGALSVINASALSAVGDASLTASTSISVLQSSVGSSGADVILTASGGSLITDQGTRVTAGGSVSQSSTGDMVIQGASVITASGHIALISSAGRLSILGASALTTQHGYVTLEADGGPVTVDNSHVTAATYLTLNASQNVLVQNSAALVAQGGDATLSAGNAMTISSATLTASGNVVLNVNGGDLTVTAGKVSAGTLGANPSSSGGSVTATVTGNTFVTAGSTVSAAGGDVSITASRAITITDSTVTASRNVILHANGGDLTVDPSTITATTGSVTGTASGNVLIEGTASVPTSITAGQNVSFIAGGYLSALSNTHITGQTGYVWLEADGTDVTVDDSQVQAGTVMTGQAARDMLVQDLAGISAQQITTTSGRHTSFTNSTLNATGTGATAGLTSTAQANVLVDAAASVTSATIATINGGYDNLAHSITLLGSFTAPLIEVRGGNGGDTFLLSPVAIDGYTQLWGGSGNDLITLHLPTIDLQHKLDPNYTGPSSLVNGTAEETAIAGRNQSIQGVNRNFDGQSLFPLRNMVDVNGGAGSDNYVVNMLGTTADPAGTDYIVNVHDSGAPTDVNTLNINGMAQASNVFLLRQNFVALVHCAGQSACGVTDGSSPAFAPQYERVNYDTSINLLQRRRWQRSRPVLRRRQQRAHDARRRCRCRLLPVRPDVRLRPHGRPGRGARRRDHHRKGSAQFARGDRPIQRAAGLQLALAGHQLRDHRLRRPR